jgi:hypothetical protein
MRWKRWTRRTRVRRSSESRPRPCPARPRPVECAARRTAPARKTRAVSSAVEHCLHTARVAGSNPAPPTRPRSRPQGRLLLLRKMRMATDYVLWHNPRCSKSRGALQLLCERGIEPGIRDYLAQPPSVDELRSLLDALGIPPRQLLRTGETAYAELELAASDAGGGGWGGAPPHAAGRHGGASPADRTPDPGLGRTCGDRASAGARAGTAVIGLSVA